MMTGRLESDPADLRRWMGDGEVIVVNEKLSGVVYGLDEEIYHSRTELSSTQARRLLESPARFHYAQTHPQPYKKAFDLGHVVHSKVLGVGAQPVLIPDEALASNGATSTTAAKEFIASSRADGLIPLKRAEYDEAQGMAEAVLAHEVARPMLEQAGDPEASVFATDPDTGVSMRARFDFLPNFTQDDPWTIDLKTTAKSAHPDEFARTAAAFRYDIQQEWYLHAYALATGDFMARMRFVVVETAPPYLVAVYPLATEFAEIGRNRVRDALNLHAECVSRGEWPGYDINPDPIQPPTWLMFQEGAIA